MSVSKIMYLVFFRIRFLTNYVCDWSSWMNWISVEKAVQVIIIKKILWGTGGYGLKYDLKLKIFSLSSCLKVNFNDTLKGKTH